MEKLPVKRGRKAGVSLEHVRKRRSDVMVMLLKGKTRDQIMEDIIFKYNISVPTVDHDIGMCHEDLRNEYQDKLQDLVATNHAKLDRLFSEWDGIDVNAQIKIIDTQNKMAGVYRNEPQVQINQLSLNLENLSVDELKKLLNNGNKD